MGITEQVSITTSFEIKLNIPEAEDTYYAERKLQIWMDCIKTTIQAGLEAKFKEKISNLAINWEMEQKETLIQV